MLHYHLHKIELIQSSQNKIHNKPISKTPFSHTYSAQQQAQPSNFHFHKNTATFKKGKIPKLQNPNQYKKFQTLNQTTTSQHRSVQPRYTTQQQSTRKLADPTKIGARKWVKNQRLFRGYTRSSRSRFKKIEKSFSDSRETNTLLPWFDSILWERTLREREKKK